MSLPDSQVRHPLQAIYDRIPAVACAGHCGRDRHKTCCGPIACTALEARLLDEFNGTAAPWESLGHGNVVMDLQAPDGRICPHLSLSGRCNAYAVRPLICRLYGATRLLACPWGCQPTRWLTDREASALLQEAGRVAARTPHAGPTLPQDASEGQKRAKTPETPRATAGARGRVGAFHMEPGFKTVRETKKMNQKMNPAAGASPSKGRKAASLSYFASAVGFNLWRNK